MDLNEDGENIPLLTPDSASVSGGHSQPGPSSASAGSFEPSAPPKSGSDDSASCSNTGAERAAEGRSSPETPENEESESKFSGTKKFFKKLFRKNKSGISANTV